MLALMIILSIIATVVVLHAMNRATKSSKNDGALTSLYQAIAGLLILLLIPFDEFKISTDWKIWLLFVTACVFYACNDRIITTLYRELPPSQIAVLKQLSSVFVIIIGLLIFREPFSSKNIIAAGIIIMGNVIILFKKQEKIREHERRRRWFYIGLGVIANLSMAIALSLDIDISENYNLAIYAALSLTIPACIIGIGDRNVNFKALKNELITGDKKAIFTASIAQGIQVFTMLKAYQLGEVVIVAPLLALSVLTNALFELIILKEKENWIRKVLVSVMIVVAVFMISI